MDILYTLDSLPNSQNEFPINWMKYMAQNCFKNLIAMLLR